MNVTEKLSHGDNVEELYAWIDQIPFSRPKKNIPRDFSDAVLMAEVLKVYYPRYVDVHNYIPASSAATKRDNWGTLNRKVLSKIDMKLSKETINQLASSQQGTIEKVLSELREKILKDCNSEQAILHDDLEKLENDGDAEEDEKKEIDLESKSLSPMGIASKASVAYFSVTRCIKGALGNAFGWLFAWIWPLFWFSRDQVKTISTASSKCSELGNESTEMSREKIFPLAELEDETDETVPRHVYLHLEQILRSKNDAINVLHHKVAHLESLIRMKDNRITDLTVHIPNLLESSQTPRKHIIGSSQSKLRTRPSKIRDARLFEKLSRV